MAFRLTITTPEGQSRDKTLTHGPQLVTAVAAALREADPRLSEREAVTTGFQIARGQEGKTWVHPATGLRFLVESAVVPGFVALNVCD